MTNANPIIYTEDEAAEVLKLDKRKLAGERMRKRIRCFRIVGNRIRYVPRQIMDYLENHPLNGDSDDSEPAA